MAAFLKILALTICIDIFLYIGYGVTFAGASFSNTHEVRVPGDFIDLFLANPRGLDSSLDAYNEGLTSGSTYSKSNEFNVNGNWSQRPNAEAAQSISGLNQGFTFLDALRIVFGFFLTLFNLVLLPITLLTSSIIPPYVGLFFGVPLAALFITSFMLVLGGRTG